MRDESIPVAILAGGVATRLRPLTETIPKALIDVSGEPFIFHQLRLLRVNGVERVTICAGYLGEMIQDRVGDGAQFGQSITYSFDGRRLLGTAGALKRALPLLTDHFFVLYGDSYLPCDYHAVQRSFFDQGRLGLMTVFQNSGRWDTSNVEFVNGQIKAYDKTKPTDRMRYIDYGLGVFDRRSFDLVPADEPADLASLYQDLLTRGELAAYEVGQRFYEIGSFDGLAEMRRLAAGVLLTRRGTE